MNPHFFTAPFILIGKNIIFIIGNKNSFALTLLYGLQSICSSA